MSMDQAVAETMRRLATLQSARTPSVDGLTRREREVAGLLALGRTNRQIAETLVVTEGTAENYVQRLLSKLGFKNRAQAAVWALERGLVTPPRSS
jgi:non-specific serine/threonine protein kinase